MTSLFGFEALHRAWLSCRRGKGASISRWQFETDLERNLLALSDELQSRRYQPSPSVCFVTEQPKRREIFAAHFRDRVIHHLVVSHLEPYWERRFIFDSYACRRGKGTQAAVDRVQQFMRQVSANGSRRAWTLHLDIRSFFVRIDKAILFAILDDSLRRAGAPWEEPMRWLIERIVFRDPSSDARRCGSGLARVPAHKSLYHTGNVTGLAIGNYTSQFFANLYLDGLDQFIKHTLRARHYVRYVDDLILMHEERDVLVRWEARIADYLEGELHLELNGARRVLAPVGNGCDAFGTIVHLRHRLLRRRTVRRLRQTLGQASDQMLRKTSAGTHLRLSSAAVATLLARCMSYRGLLLHTDSERLRARLCAAYLWIGLFWRIGADGRLQRRDHPRALWGSLRVQIGTIRRCWRQAVALVRVGSHWELYGRDRAELAPLLDLRAGRWRAGFGIGAGFALGDRRRLRLVMTLPHRPVILIDETGERCGRIADRRVVQVWLPDGSETFKLLHTVSRWL